jgi:hypothetical protein
MKTNTVYRKVMWRGDEAGRSRGRRFRKSHRKLLSDE